MLRLGCFYGSILSRDTPCVAFGVNGGFHPEILKMPCSMTVRWHTMVE